MDRGNGSEYMSGQNPSEHDDADKNVEEIKHNMDINMKHHGFWTEIVFPEVYWVSIEIYSWWKIKTSLIDKSKKKNTPKNDIIPSLKVIF